MSPQTAQSAPPTRDNPERRRPRVLLIFPTPISTIPPGLTYVAKRFDLNGFDVHVHVNTFDNFRTVDQLKADLVDPYQPDIVGLSYATFGLLEVYRLQKLCRQAGHFVIAGGPHPSALPEEAVVHDADMAFRGEAEPAIDAFCRWWLAGRDPATRDTVANITYLDDQRRPHTNPLAPRIDPLDELGGTDFSYLDLDTFRVADGSIKGLQSITSGRGCPFRCTYCSHSLWLKHTLRSPESMVDEIVSRHDKYGLSQFWMNDETFTVSKDHAYQFCRTLKATGLPITWMMATRVTGVDEPLLRTMKDAGLVQITYGVESADDETLKRIRKGYTVQKAYDAVTMTGRVGVPQYINMMTGFPWETPESVEHNIRFIRTVGRHVNCFQLYGAVIPYPDTPIYDEYHQQAGFTNWWLKPRFQDAGMVIYQNVANPYLVSTYFQRNLYDDTYVAEDYFFTFSPEYKRAVAQMGYLFGWKSVCAQTPSTLKRWWRYGLGRASHMLYRASPVLEKRVVGSLAKTNRVHRTRQTAVFVKSTTPIHTNTRTHPRPKQAAPRSLARK
ncbi:MAG: B12-binding domain-containing radical SAM protein [bacterium]|nr:B12-binding domain-containing radical SAM protein [bacterium]